MILDSNVIIDLIDPDAPDRIRNTIAALRAGSPPRVNEIIFAEIARAFADAAEVSGMLAAIEVELERLTLSECHRAGQAFAEYRRRNGGKSTILPDFLIGAQAASRGWPLVTRDRKGFASYFPELQIIDPMEA